MTIKDNGGLAFPDPARASGHCMETGLSLRQYAAIKLRVPDSGTDWLDDMILEARRMDYAGQAQGAAWDARDKGYFEGDDNDMAQCAYKIADAMIAARGQK